MCTNETFKILKFRNQIAMYGLNKFSNRGHKHHFIITPSQVSALLTNQVTMVYDKKHTSY